MKQLWPLIGAALLAAALSACSAPSDNDLAAVEVQTARAQEAAQRAQILAALEPLDPLRYHELDALVRDEHRIPAEAVTWARRAHEVLNWVDWPPELAEHVTQYDEWLESLLAAFDDDDPHAAAEPSKIVHALAHTFEATLEAWLSNESLPAVPPLAGLEPPMHAHAQDSQSSNAEHSSHDE